MRLNTATALDLQTGDLRLDASYYASSGQQINYLFKNSGLRTDRLDQVCQPNGVFIPGRFRRVYVNNPEHGVRWLSPSDMQKADLSGLEYVSRKYTPDLDVLRLHKEWILLSRSGTIGNLVYVRADMDGLIGSDDIIRIVSDPEKILSGYLFAILSSSLMVRLIQQKTYGAVILHIEAHHVIDLPIPRLEPAQEERIHQLIEQAAELRVEAQHEIDLLRMKCEQEILGISQDYKIQWPYEWSYGVGKVKLSMEDSRLDAFFYIGHTVEYRKFINTGPILNAVAEIKRPGIFKRNYIGKGGVPFLSGVDIYHIKAEARLWISPSTTLIDEITIKQKGTILVQADGQRYGILGRPVFADQKIVGSAVSDHLVRIIPNEPIFGGYIYIYLSTDAGRRELIRGSYGTSIPTIPLSAFQQLQIPGIYSKVGKDIGKRALNALEKRTQANQLEDHAQELLGEFLGIDMH